MHEHHVLLDLSDPLGVLVVVAGSIATLVTFVLAFRMSVRPGEEAEDHPKRTILREDR
ncbi:MAG: hypothetical protein JWO66_2888 [Candidatus Eremiobacteraeota bacterium]|jgi:hypothetical protein|nr:hypothetical protein [Candidatus Eremiobacteraeota bacterium]